MWPICGFSEYLHVESLEDTFDTENSMSSLNLHVTLLIKSTLLPNLDVQNVCYYDSLTIKDEDKHMTSIGSLK